MAAAGGPPGLEREDFYSENQEDVFLQVMKNRQPEDDLSQGDDDINSDYPEDPNLQVTKIRQPEDEDDEFELFQDAQSQGDEDVNSDNQEDSNLLAMMTRQPEDEDDVETHVHLADPSDFSGHQSTLLVMKTHQPEGEDDEFEYDEAWAAEGLLDALFRGRTRQIHDDTLGGVIAEASGVAIDVEDVVRVMMRMEMDHAVMQTYMESERFHARFRLDDENLLWQVIPEDDDDESECGEAETHVHHADPDDNSVHQFQGAQSQGDVDLNSENQEDTHLLVRRTRQPEDEDDEFEMGDPVGDMPFLCWQDVWAVEAASRQHLLLVHRLLPRAGHSSEF